MDPCDRGDLSVVAQCDVVAVAAADRDPGEDVRLWQKAGARSRLGKTWPVCAGKSSYIVSILADFVPGPPRRAHCVN